MKIITSILGILISLSMLAQNKDSIMIRSIFENAMTNQEAYNNLEFLSTETSGRLIGTEESIRAVDFMKSYMEIIGVDTIFLQEFTADSWVCDHASLDIISDNGAIPLSIDAIGPSGSTPEEGIECNIIEVQQLNELDKLGSENIEGKIVFFNRPMKNTFYVSFHAYGDAVDQRYWGPTKAAEYGATAVIVRSLTTNIDDHPHTGSCRFDGERIAAVAVSTKDAELLSDKLQENPELKVHLKVRARDLKDFTSYNLIADIKGHKYPDEIILVGGHIDSWFNSPGAHDDGAGCVQSADVLRIFKDLGIENKRTIRMVLFMDEELFQQGGQAYAAYTKDHALNHMIAIESDAGGLTPTGFTLDAREEIIESVSIFQPLLEPYGIGFIRKGYGGVDIGPLKAYQVPLCGLNIDSQRYFDYHHSPNDTFEQVNFRELQLGSACITGLIYLLDKYGIE